MILADVGKVFMVLSSVTKHCQEQRTAPRRRQVGVAPEIRVSGRGLRSFAHVGGAQFPPRVYLQCNQRRTRVRAEALKQLSGPGLVKRGINEG